MKPEELIEYGFSETEPNITYSTRGRKEVFHNTYFIRGRKELLLLVQKIGYVNDDLNELLTNDLDFQYDCWIETRSIISKKIDTIDLVEYEYQFTGPLLSYPTGWDTDSITMIKRKLLEEELDKLIKYMEKYFNEGTTSYPKIA